LGIDNYTLKMTNVYKNVLLIGNRDTVETDVANYLNGELAESDTFIDASIAKASADRIWINITTYGSLAETKTYTNTLLLKKRGLTSTYTNTVLLKKKITKTYSNTLLIKKEITKTHTMDVILYHA